jgi:hypothetical protein
VVEAGRMTFTDDDLKRLKDLLRDKGDLSTFFDTYEDMEALLARLELAECIVEHCIKNHDDGDDELEEQWRKSCGL